MNEESKDKENKTQDSAILSYTDQTRENINKDNQKQAKEIEGIEEDEGKEKKVLSLYQKVQAMTVPEKIQLALKGDKEARDLLIRDSNKMVSTAVIKSPKISESEVLQVAQSTSVDEDILRIISKSNEWMGKYKIKLKLVNNAKTPLDISMKLVSSLRDRDLRLLGKSKNISPVLATKAKKLSDQKSKR
ncbi:MAG: hypothetical protein SWO11_11170 [Thermodesulfobacteriota bacterium]|nr:hypothetical protein [Thermodesulfobacteriota bacterium]